MFPAFHLGPEDPQEKLLMKNVTMQVNYNYHLFPEVKKSPDHVPVFLVCNLGFSFYQYKGKKEEKTSK